MRSYDVQNDKIGGEEKILREIQALNFQNSPRTGRKIGLFKRRSL